MAQMQGIPTNKPVMLVLHDIDLNSKLSLLREVRAAGYVVLNTPNGISPERTVKLAQNAGTGALVLWGSDDTSVTWLKETIRAFQAADLAIPLIIGGPAITADIAQQLPHTEAGMYKGVYDYIDIDEIMQIFKHIVFYTPPKPAHSHEHEDEEACTIVDDESSCASCASDCPMNKS